MIDKIAINVADAIGPIADGASNQPSNFTLTA
jgi:hypothetical protein